MYAEWAIFEFFPFMALFAGLICSPLSKYYRSLFNFLPKLAEFE